MMQLNIRSILAHQSKLRQLLQTMANKNSQTDVLLLCETFLTTRTERLVNILGYSLVTNNRKDYKGGVVAILIKHGITFRKRNDLNIMKEKTIESVYVDVTAKNGNIYTIGNLYRAPNSDIKGIMDHIDYMVNKTNTKTKNKLTIGMDQNLNLLKSEDHHIQVNLWI